MLTSTFFTKLFRFASPRALAPWSLMLLAALAAPASAQAQDQRLRLSVGGATTSGAIDAEPAVTASVGYRFANRLSFDVDVTRTEATGSRFGAMPLGGVGILERGGGLRGVATPGALGGRVPSVGAIGQPVPIGQIFPPIESDHDGSTTLATVGVRYALPSQVDRFQPYVTGGIGIARTEERFVYIIAAANAPPRPGAPAVAPTRGDNSVSHTGLAATAGLGASIRVFRQLSADIDVRYFRLDGKRNIGRFGGGVSYKF